MKTRAPQSGTRVFVFELFQAHCSMHAAKPPHVNRYSPCSLYQRSKLGNGHVTLHRTVIEAVFQHVLVRLADHRAWFDA